MKYKIGLTLGIIAFLILVSVGLTFSQTETVQTEAVIETQPEPETQWLWGEVNSVDIQKKELLVKYLDYETDQEKEMTIAVDDKTTYENVKSIEEIKPKDTVSIDYVISADGRNIAKNISVEKPESEEAPQEGNVTESTPETTPEDLQPVSPQEE